VNPQVLQVKSSKRRRKSKSKGKKSKITTRTTVPKAMFTENHSKYQQF